MDIVAVLLSMANFYRNKTLAINGEISLQAADPMVMVERVARDGQELQLYFPRSMGPHIQRVMDGEYDVAYTHPTPVILDIGANVGAFVIWALMMKWPSATIHCYEPNPVALTDLKRNTAIFGSSVEIHPMAVGRESCRRKLYQGIHNIGEASFFDIGEQDMGNSVEVDVLDASSLPAANVVKIDTEGSEFEILRGMIYSHLSDITDVVLLEYHSDELRRQCDALLQNYVLVGGVANTPVRGTMKYMHRRLVA